MSNKLFVGNLSFNTTENDLQDMFAAHGTVVEANLMVDRVSGRPRGFGFVTMGSPEEMRRNIQGTTTLIVSIDANGAVLDVEVERSSGNRNLDRAAVQAARRWRFNAEVRDGKKIASRVRVPVDFKLQ